MELRGRVHRRCESRFLSGLRTVRMRRLVVRWIAGVESRWVELGRVARCTLQTELRLGSALVAVQMLVEGCSARLEIDDSAFAMVQPVVTLVLLAVVGSFSVAAAAAAAAAAGFARKSLPLTEAQVVQCNCHSVVPVAAEDVWEG